MSVVHTNFGKGLKTTKSTLKGKQRVHIDIAISGKGAIRLILFEAPTSEARSDHNTENYVRHPLRYVCGFFNVPCQPCSTENARGGDYDL